MDVNENLKEKLVELIAQKVCDTWSESCDEWLPHDCGKCYANDCLISEIADHLISNGVTVQEWVPMTERLPERDKEVLLIVHGWEDRLYYTGCLHRQEAERSWLTGIESKASDWTIWGFSYLREPIVTHWMPLPEPPKEELA